MCVVIRYPVDLSDDTLLHRVFVIVLFATFIKERDGVVRNIEVVFEPCRVVFLEIYQDTIRMR